MKKITLIFILFHFLFSVHAQIINGLSIGIESNSAWYNDDKKTGAFNDENNNDQDKHLRFNNYIKLDYNFLSKFTLRLSLTNSSDALLEISVKSNVPKTVRI